MDKSANSERTEPGGSSMLAKQKHRERTNNANGMRRSKVTEVESSNIEKEATELKT